VHRDLSERGLFEDVPLDGSGVVRKRLSASARGEAAAISIDPQDPARRPRKRRNDATPGSSLGWLPIFGGILLLVVGSAFALLRRHELEDPHLTRAKAVLGRYELGTAEEGRDYGDLAYVEALDELALVDRDSPSVQPADELAADIRRRAADQRARVSTRAVEMRARQELEQGRDEEFFRERRLRPTPDPGAPASDFPAR
jgi:hypothetical protein